jgi:hypothetical protein
MKISERIQNSLIIQKLYRLMFHFELGKSQVARFYCWIPEIIIIIGGLKYLLGINMTKKFIITFFVTIIIIFTIVGLIIHKTGLYNVDRYVQTSKDPVQTEILLAARKINSKVK